MVVPYIRVALPFRRNNVNRNRLLVDITPCTPFVEHLQAHAASRSLRRFVATRIVGDSPLRAHPKGGDNVWCSGLPGPDLYTGLYTGSLHQGVFDLSPAAAPDSFTTAYVFHRAWCRIRLVSQMWW